MAAPPVQITQAPRRSSTRRRGSRWPFWLGLFCTVVYLAARALRSYTEDAAHLVLASTGLALLDARWKVIGETLAVAACVALAMILPLAPWRWLCGVERAIARFAAHKTQAILFTAIFPMLLRLAMLPVLPVPEPVVADEFGYLLLADTFASGRVSNPAHPFWPHFESTYVLQEPAYTSIYPIAPAVLMAIPMVLGAHPWLGVWLGTGLMSGLLCWMLQGWVPPKWALLGGFLAAGRFAVTGPWINTYWGGATAAIGGALLIGALARIIRYRRGRDAILFGLGLAVLAQSRPYEGLMLGAPLSLALAVWLMRERVVFGRRIGQVAAPLAAVAAALVAGTAYYNWRVTGSPMVMPYGLHQKVYGTPQSFYWQAPIADAPGIHRARDLADVFRWQLDAYHSQFSWRSQAERLARLWHFYLQPLLTLPLLFLPLLWKDRRLRTLLIAAAAVLAGNALYPFFFPHYAAPLCALFLLLVVEGMRRVRALRWQSRRVGVLLFHTWFFLVVLSSASTVAGSLLRPWDITVAATARSRALAELKELGGKHLVLVRYSPDHSFHHSVVYNGSDIDASDVVWARELDPESNRKLAAYYAGRDVWRFNPDEDPATLVPLSGRPYISSVVPAAGRRDDIRVGVSPGSIAVLLGGNFAHEVNGATGPRAVLGPVPVVLAAVTPSRGNVFVPLQDAASDVPALKRELSVRFDGRPAPVLSASKFDDQESLTVQVPPGLALGPASVTIETGGESHSRKIRILPAAPGIFQMRMKDAQVRAILLRPDGTLVDLDHPARRGEVLRLFATGLGARAPSREMLVGVNHRGVRLVDARFAATPGVEEVDFEVPSDAPSGPNIPLAIAALVDGKPVFGNKSSLPIE